MTGVVAINGFSRFARSEAGPGVPRRVIAQMLAGFDADPARVLRQFRAGCGVTDAIPPIDAAMLRDDLVMLRDGTAPTPTVPVLSLEGGRDHLLDPDTRAAQFPRDPAGAARASRRPATCCRSRTPHGVRSKSALSPERWLRDRSRPHRQRLCPCPRL
ncbi:hypothetical protein ACFSTD_21445 [Novosphingobium colocasiae]